MSELSKRDPRFRSEAFRLRVREKLMALGETPSLAAFRRWDKVLDWMDNSGGVTIVRGLDGNGVPVGERFGLLDPERDFDEETMVKVDQW